MRFYFNLTLISLLLFSGLKTFAQQDTSSLNLHVPSPDWEDQIIYFLMTDRFNDGNPANNDQGAGEYDPAIAHKYSGGDIQGVIDKLDYIQNLGATAVWTTPLFANQWWDGINNFSGYHGYWAEHFKEVDKHAGTLVDFQQLSHHLHERGMYLIQDIVLNHTGNFYLHNGKYNPENPAENFGFNDQSFPVQAPTQYPFNLNDVRKSEHKKADIYNWTPDIIDYGDDAQRVKYALAGLDDINTQNVVVREVFRDSYGYWIRVVGVDGFRIDTIIYVEKDFWNDFMYSQSEKAPGMHKVAEATGRDEFIAFGEAFVSSEPFENKGDLEVASYMGTEDQPGLNSMLNFPLYYSMTRIFAQGKPTSFLGYRLDQTCNAGIYPNPHIIPHFIDNHDTDRFINSASKEGLKQALFFQFSIPGIPIIYAGTEQLLHEARASMFAEGWGSEGHDHFDENSEMYLFIKSLAEVRKQHKVLTRGNLTILEDSDLGPGVLAYKREYEGKTAIVILNTADEPILLNKLETGLKGASKLKLISGMNIDSDLRVAHKGKLTMVMPPRMSGIFLVEEPKIIVGETSSIARILTDISGKTFSNDIKLKGEVRLRSASPYLLVIDGKINNAIPLEIDKKLKWKLTIPKSYFPFGKSNHNLTIYNHSQIFTLPSIPFSTDIPVQGKELVIEDPLNDDHGLDGNYLKPTDVSYTSQMDIRQVKTTSFGGSLLIELTMADLSQVWLPPNGFDHALFHVTIDLPNTTGSDYLPMLNTKTPDNFEWDYTTYISGWQTVHYSSKGASKENYGTKQAIAPIISVIPEENKVLLQFTASAFGNPTSLEGAKLYITTWDSYGNEGGYRQINKEGGPWRFGGSDDPKATRILDATKVIEIK